MFANCLKAPIQPNFTSRQDREAAAQSLANSPRIGSIAGELKMALPEASAPVRVCLVRLLGYCPKEESVPVLLEALDESLPQP